VPLDATLSCSPGGTATTSSLIHRSLKRRRTGEAMLKARSANTRLRLEAVARWSVRVKPATWAESSMGNTSRAANLWDGPVSFAASMRKTSMVSPGTLAKSGYWATGQAACWWVAPARNTARRSGATRAMIGAELGADG
jgi:hypothetical protein